MQYFESSNIIPEEKSDDPVVFARSCGMKGSPEELLRFEFVGEFEKKFEKCEKMIEDLKKNGRNC